MVAVADLRATPGAPAAELQRAGAEVLAGRTALEAEGRKAVQAVTLGALSDHNGSGPRERRFECDLLVMSGGVAPATSLIAQAGGRTAYDDARGHFAIAELPDGVHAAGAVAGGAATTPSRSGRARRRRRPRTRSASATAPPAPANGATGRAAPEGRAARRGGRRARQVLRLPVRGRHGEGHPSQRRRGL